MDGTVEAVLRLEDAKRKALVDFDASAYDDHLRAQLRLLETSTPAAIAAQSSSADILALAKLIRLNSLLYHNLLSISPWIQQPRHAYTSGGHFAAGTGAKRFSAEV
jgi:hypothetical protein